MLGDQIYADQPSPALQRASPRRERPADAPEDELADFSEYALAYHEAWSDPAIRWLLSTVPVTMVFDDHEIHAEWRISQGWLDEMNAEPWFDDHIRAGLMAYWVFQHIGNLSPAELRRRRAASTRSARPTTPATCSPSAMDTEGRQVGHSRWSFARDLGDARLVVIDSRAGRQVDARAPRARPGRGVALDPRAGLASRPATCCSRARCRSCSRPACTTSRPSTRRWPTGAWGRLGAMLGEKLRRVARHGPLGVVPAHLPPAGRAARRRRARPRRRRARVDRDALGRRPPLLPRRGRLPARHRARAARCGRRSARRSARSSRPHEQRDHRVRALAARPSASRGGWRAPPGSQPLPLDWRVVEEPGLRQPDRDAAARRRARAPRRSRRSPTATGATRALEARVARELS